MSFLMRDLKMYLMWDLKRRLPTPDIALCVFSIVVYLKVQTRLECLIKFPLHSIPVNLHTLKCKSYVINCATGASFKSNLRYGKGGNLLLFMFCKRNISDLVIFWSGDHLRVSTRIQPKSHIYALLWKKMQNKKLFWDAKQTKTTQTLNILDSLSDITRTVIATVLIVTTTTHMHSIWIDERWTPRFGIAIYCGARSVLHSQEREREDAVITRSIWWWCFCIISKAGHDNYFVQIQLTSYTRRSKHFIFFANLIVFCFSSPL